MNKYVEITNPEGDHAKVLPQSLPVWEARGWTLVDDGSSETPAQATEQHQAEDQRQLSLLDDENKE